MSGRFSHTLIPVALVLVVAAALTTIVILVGRDPVIHGVVPAVASSGAEVVIDGRFFGSVAGTLTVGNRRVPAGGFLEWSDTSIRFTVPPDTDSGLVRVTTDRGRSRGMLLLLREALPRAQGEAVVPTISALSHTELAVGRLVEIVGTNFGPARRSAVVEFSTVGAACSECDEQVMYAEWSDERIVVRVPADAVGGTVRVRTPWGISNPLDYSIARPAGGPVRVDRSEIVLEYGARIADVLVDPPASALHGSSDLWLRLPAPHRSFDQDAIRFLSAPGEHHLFERIDATFERDLIHKVVLNRYEVRYNVEASAVPSTYESGTGFFAYYTRDLPGLSVADPAVVSAAAEARRGRTNPYRIAEAAYNLTRSRLAPALGLDDQSAATALATGYGDSLAYTQLLVGLLRAARIPARTVGGVLVTRDRHAYPHFWAEFFVPDVGWVPADPALGDGAFPARFPEPDDPAAYYFGGLDSYRVAFTRGVDGWSPPNSATLRVYPEQPYTMQSTYLAAGSSVRSISLHWLAPRVLGVVVPD